MTLTRELEYTPPESDTPRTVRVSVGVPEPDPLPGGDFRVRVEIVGFDDAYAKYTFGVDAIQALILALGTVPDVVHALAGGGRVTWLGYDDLGFRYTPPA